GNGRVPPPPVLRDEVRVERVADQDSKRGSGSKGKGSSSSRKKRNRRADVDVSDVDFGKIPSDTAKKLERRLIEAALAFDAERFTEVVSLLDSIDRLAPGVAEVYELRALANYRLGHWMKAIADLERFYDLTGSVEQHPVWADCCRALRRWTRAEELWIELGDASPSAELVEEGRLVYAGGLADRGRVDEAIRLLEKAPRPPKRPAGHHLRRWYLLADLYERSGDLAHARRVFGDIATSDAQFGDVAERLASLG
ncbi:MAG: tetratricopeptide repeat protein, partial [Acidimicrobiales bacterium]